MRPKKNQENYTHTTRLEYDTVISLKDELQEFISRKTQISKPFHRVGEIMAVLRKIITQEKMLHENNPNIILCSEELEMALGTKILTVNELEGRVMTQVEFASEYSKKDTSTRRTYPKGACYATHVQINKNCYFQPKSALLNILQNIQKGYKTKTIFTYNNICLLLTKYIKKRKSKFFYHQNMSIAFVKDDPLDIAFGVSAFHENQATMFLLSQLTQVKIRRSIRIRNRALGITL